MVAYRAVPSAFIDGPTPQIGEGTRIWHGAHIMSGAVIGRDCNIGQNVYIDSDVHIGDGCKLQNNVNVYRGVTLAENVFCGPSMTFTNLSHPLPRAAISRHHMLQKTQVRRGASFGAGSVIVCGHEIGAYAFVAAGAVVIRDVGPFELAAGNPARRIGYVCVCGGRLRFEGDRATCADSYDWQGSPVVCGRTYARTAEGQVDLVYDPHGGAGG